MREVKEYIATVKAKRELLKLRLQELEELSKAVETRITNLKDARDVVTFVSFKCQKEIKSVLEFLVTKALQSVFGKEYSFELELEIKRNKQEATPYIVKDGKKRSIKDENGGGVVDLISFCMRIIIWSLQSPRTSRTIILDEPLKFLDKNHLLLAGDMIKEMSKTLGIQFIIVSHEDGVISAADRAFMVEQSDGISRIKIIQ